MKKLIALLLVLVMAVSMVACGENPETTAPTTEPTNAPTEPPVQLPASALELLQGAWTAYFGTLTEDQKFPVAGGFSDNFEEMVMDNAGPVKVELEGSMTNLFVPEDSYASVEEASSVAHMMNANTFTAGALKLKDGTDVAAFTQAMRDLIANNHWFCGFPDRFVIVSVGNYVIVIYGQDGVEIDGFKTAEIVTPFVNAMSQYLPTAKILFNEQISG